MYLLFPVDVYGESLMISKMMSKKGRDTSCITCVVCFFFLKKYLFLCMRVHTRVPQHIVDVRGQLVGVGSSLQAVGPSGQCLFRLSHLSCLPQCVSSHSKHPQRGEELAEYV